MIYPVFLGKCLPTPRDLARVGGGGSVLTPVVRWCIFFIYFQLIGTPGVFIVHLLPAIRRLMAATVGIPDTYRSTCEYVFRR